MYSNHRQKILRRMTKIQPHFLRPLSPDRNSFWRNFFVDLCHNLSFHGLNHFVDDDRSPVEK